MEGKSIKQYTLERLFPPETAEEQAMDELKALLTERVAQAERGELAQGRISEIAEQALNTRE